MPDLEHQPLLYDDPSDEEFQRSLSRHKRFRCGNRTLDKNNLKGAVVLLKQWPDYWSSIFLYWWTVVGMITITVLIIYNAVITFALMPTPNPIQKYNDSFIENAKNNNSDFPNVFMHIIANHNENLDRHLSKYLPYIESIRNKYLDFNFNVIIVYNDTESNFPKIMNAESMNDIANSFRSGLIVLKKYKITSIIKHSMLSNIMDKSPLKKQWRHLPHPLIPFLLRAVSVWQKGGIAFDPIILTPHFSQTYMYKIEEILQQFISSLKSTRSDSVPRLHYLHIKKNTSKKLPNNILDILNALDDNDTNTDHNLSVAENKVNEITISKNNKLISAISNKINETNNKTIVIDLNRIVNKDFNQTSKENYVSAKESISEFSPSTKMMQLNSDKLTKPRLFPIFFKYLFKKPDHNITITKNEHLKLSDNIYITNVNDLPIVKNNIYITTARTMTNEFSNDKKISDETLNLKLTIDLKGYLIATQIPCHAFVGSLFSDLIHYEKKETITDFMIKEISLFCKGNLSTCKGIDVILV